MKVTKVKLKNIKEKKKKNLIRFCQARTPTTTKLDYQYKKYLNCKVAW